VVEAVVGGLVARFFIGSVTFFRSRCIAIDARSQVLCYRERHAQSSDAEDNYCDTAAR
jgi:hypothetical protein